VIGRTLLDECAPARAAAFGESHTGEGIAQERAGAGSQNIVNSFIRGSQEYKIITHLLHMKLVGGNHFSGNRETNQPGGKYSGTRASTSNYRVVSGRTVTAATDLLTKRTSPPLPRVLA